MENLSGAHVAHDRYNVANNLEFIQTIARAALLRRDSRVQFIYKNNNLIRCVGLMAQIERKNRLLSQRGAKSYAKKTTCKG